MNTTGAAELTVSVALCTHNGERFIAEQVRSILAQSRPPVELVLSDDASTDGTVDIAISLVEQHNRDAASPVRLVVLRNVPALGIAGNFEQAISACTADLVALSDQDDRWAPDRLELAVAEFEKRPALTLLHADARRIDEAGEPLEHSLFDSLHVSAWERQNIDSGMAMKVLVRRNLVTGATTLFRRELVATAMPIPLGWIHDEWLGMIAAATGVVAMDRRLLVDYRQHGGNQIGASQLSFREKLNKLREPRSERNRNLYVRARELVTRLQELDGIAALPLRLAWEKQEHERYRVALPINRARRALPVLATAARGNYRRYGLGAQDVLRDLVQPVE